jgi:hypothetical protein
MNDDRELVHIHRLRRQAPDVGNEEMMLWVVTLGSGQTTLINMSLDQAVYVEEHGYENKIRAATEQEQVEMIGPAGTPETRAETAPDTTTNFYAFPGYLEEMSDQELYNAAIQYNIKDVPNPPFSNRQRQRLISTIQFEDRKDYIYGGPPQRRRPVEQIRQVEGDYVIQWNIDGPWVDLQGFNRLADAEEGMEKQIRYHAADGLTKEDFRLVYRGESGGIIIPKGRG